METPHIEVEAILKGHSSMCRLEQKEVEFSEIISKPGYGRWFSWRVND